MKVLHILDHSLPLHSGYTFRSRNIFKCQQAQGIDPVVVTSPKHEESWKGERSDSEEIDGVRYYRTGEMEGGRVPFIRERKLMNRLEQKIIETAKQEKPDLLHAHSPVLNAIPAEKAARKLGIPMVYEIRAFWEDAGVDHGTYRENGLKYKFVRNLETKCCRKADFVLTICQGLKNDLLKRGISEAKLDVVPNAVNVDEFEPVERDIELARQWRLDNGRVVGFLGSFYHYEGLDILLEAAAMLGDVADLKFLFVGGGPEDKELRRKAAALNLDNRIVFTGRLPHEQMPAMYALVDVLCFPRKAMRLTELVTPLKPLEAMSMGKAVVASNVGGHRELIMDGETGLLFQADDPKALADCLRKILGNETLGNDLTNNGRVWVRKNRSWAENGSRYSRLYERLLAR